MQIFSLLTNPSVSGFPMLISVRPWYAFSTSIEASIPNLILQFTTEAAAVDVAAFVSIFFDNFSQFKGRNFHMAGESYGVSDKTIECHGGECTIIYRVVIYLSSPQRCMIKT